MPNIHRPAQLLGERADEPQPERGGFAEVHLLGETNPVIFNGQFQGIIGHVPEGHPDDS